MLKVECEACKAPYQVDERRVPPTGLKMRCPKCGHAFTVLNPDAPDAPQSKHTIMGVAAPMMPSAAPPVPAASRAPAPPAAPRAAAPLAIDDDLLPDRPAPKAPPAKPGPPKAPPAKPPPPKAAPARVAPAIGEIDELMDLPAMPEPALPAIVKPLPPIKPTLASPQSVPFNRPAAKPIPTIEDYDLDLPSATADLPSARPAAKLAAKGPTVGGALGGALAIDDDLPLAAGAGGDLPTAKAGAPKPKKPGGMGDLPAPRGDVGLPAARGDVGLPAAFGDIGLPAAFGDIALPSPADGGFGSINLPALGATPGLPVATQGASGLPSATDQDRYLPRASGAGAHLPASMSGEMHLPSALDALPSGMGSLPSNVNSLPSAVSDHNFLPAGQSLGAASFGEADFGDPGAGPAAAAPAKAVRGGGQGGVGFGELDFGASDGGAAVGIEGDTGTPASLRGAGAEVSLPPGDIARTRDRGTIAKNQGRGAKIVAVALVAGIIGGTLLQLTSYGAFGYHLINDFTHKSDWGRGATDAMAVARKAIGGDLYDQARGAADTLASQSTALPRSHALAAAAVLAEYEFQVRYGRDAARATKVDAWLSGIKQATGNPGAVPFYNAAAAGRAAALPDVVAARGLLEAASLKDTGDPVQEDIAFLRGELELKAKDAAAAMKAFTRALQIAPSARAHYGLARSYYLAAESDADRTANHAKALSEIALALAATPNHPGALILKARIAWEDDRDDAAVIEGLKPLLDGPAKASASPSELSRAFTLDGFAQVSRGDVGSARTAFESGLKLDGANAEALLGQGEVFYAEGRYTEAMSRFDTAVQSDPTSAAIIVADAKAKMALERLADAKTQLVAAQKATPKSMQITYWLGRAEEKLGNKKGAEDAYVGAIALANPKDHDAILPYVALSTLLAGQGRATEAEARLNDARTKLPDSATMQRALGEVAAAQGLFDEAIAHYRAAAAKDPNDLGSQFLLGETYLRMRRLDDAAAEFDKVAAKDKDYPNLAMRRGELLEQSGHIDQALEQFRAALAKAPNDLDLQLRVGAAYVGIGRGDEAYKILKPVYDNRQNSAEVNHYLGRALLLQGGTAHLVDAMQHLKRAADIEPTRAEYHLYVAWVATESKDYKLAEIEVAKALELDALLGDAYWQRGVIEEVHGTVDDAIRDVTKALVLHPSRNEAHATLAKCYADKNQTEKALAEWALATTHSPEHPEWEFYYGRMLFEGGKVAQALPHVLVASKAGEALPSPPVWLAQAEFMTAEGLRKSGNKVDAKEHYIRYLSVADRSAPDVAEARRQIKAIDPEYHFQN